MNLNPKVSAAAIAGAVTLVIVFTLTQFGVAVPADVASALTIIVACVVAYAKDASGWSPK